MGYTVADVRARVRVELADTQRPQTWSDERLGVLVGDAARRVGEDVPVPKRVVVVVEDDGQSFFLPSDVERMMAVEVPIGTYIPQGDSYDSDVMGQCWQAGGELGAVLVRLRQIVPVLTQAAVHYLAGFAQVPTDPTVAFVPDGAYLEGVVLATCMLAEGRLTDAPAGSGQVAGLRADVGRYARLYAAWLVQQRKKRGIIQRQLTTVQGGTAVEGVLAL